MGARARFRARATSLLSEYQRLERAAQDAARRNNASLWYVPPTLAGIYQDHSATVNPALDGVIGAIDGDAQDDSTLGPELMVQELVKVPANWSQTAGASLTYNAEGWIELESAASGICLASTAIPVPTIPGAVYEVQCETAALSGQACGAHSIDNPLNSTIYLSPGHISTSFKPVAFTFSAIDAQTYVGFRLFNTSGAGIKAAIRNISVRQVLRNSIPPVAASAAKRVTQATTANKPTLVRTVLKSGPQRLGGAWSTPPGYANVTTSLSPTSFDTVGAAGPTRVAQLLLQTKPGVTYKVSLRVESLSIGVMNVYVRDGGTLGAGTVIHTNSAGLASGSYYESEFVAASSQMNVLFVCATASASLSVREISVREVEARGFAFLFDGTNDEMLSPGAIISDYAQYTLVAAVLTPIANVNYTVFSQRGASFTPIVAKLAFNASTATESRFSLSDRDDANLTSGLTNPELLLRNQTPVVVSGWRSGGAKKLSINGNSPAVGSASFLGTITTVQSSMGGNLGKSSDYWQGTMFLLCVAPIAMPDADRIAIEKFAAYLSGTENYVG